MLKMTDEIPRVQPLTIEVEVLLINGEKRNVVLRKYLGARQQDQILNKLTDGMKITPGMKKEDIDLDAKIVTKVISDLGETIWYDKNTSIEDVEGESLRNVLMERFNTFLGRLGFTAESGDSSGSKDKKDK